MNYKKLTLVMAFIVFFLQLGTAQIFPICPVPGGVPGDPPGNPGAVVPVTGTFLSPTEYLVQSQEICIQGDDINNGVCGEDPEWRLDIAIPPSLLNTCIDIQFRICRRGDFGQSNEDLFILDENFNQLALIDGLTGVRFDCTDGPACTQVTTSSCLFNEQVADGIWSLTFYTNGQITRNTVGDFCNLASGPQFDARSDTCGAGTCADNTQSVTPNGLFQNQANGGPMVNSTCIGCNCLFIDYMLVEFASGDPIFEVAEDCLFPGDVIDLEPVLNGCNQEWSITGGGTLSGTTGIVDYTAATPGAFQICNTAGNIDCLEELCIDIVVKEPTCAEFIASGRSLCEFLLENPTSALATLDCDGGGFDNLTECDPSGDGSGVGGIDPLDPSDDSTLPIELLFFTAEADAVDGVLKWATASEIDNSHFEVERSSDGINFVQIAIVDSQVEDGNSDIELNYEYTDKNAGSDAESIFYRVKQIDFDGSFAFTPVRLVTFENIDIGNALFPNPVVKGENVTIQSQSIESVHVYNLAGELVQEVIEIEAQRSTSISTSQLASGFYIIVINSDKTMKLIIN